MESVTRVVSKDDFSLELWFDDRWCLIYRALAMPTISMFYGIIIRMLFMDTQQHHLPHLHVEYQGEAGCDFNTGWKFA